MIYRTEMCEGVVGLTGAFDSLVQVLRPIISTLLGRKDSLLLRVDLEVEHALAAECCKLLLQIRRSPASCDSVLLLPIFPGPPGGALKSCASRAAKAQHESHGCSYAERVEPGGIELPLSG